MQFRVSLFLTVVGAAISSNSPARNALISRKGVSNERFNANYKLMNIDQRQCGTSWNLGPAHSVTQKLCPDRISDINMCCAVHDDCYKLQRGQKNCDIIFCNCLEKTREWSIYSSCIGFVTKLACGIVTRGGSIAYHDTTPEDDSKFVQYTPALNKTAKKYYKALYTECSNIKKTLSNCAYNHMVCHLQILPDRSPQTYEDCVDRVIQCLDESSETLVDNNSSCRKAVENAMVAVAFDSKLSGIPVIHEARKPKKIYFPVEIQDTSPVDSEP